MQPNSDGPWPTIPAMTLAAAERFGDRLAVSDRATTLNYAGLFDAARSFGAALVASGVQPGDRVAIWTFNSAEWVVACLGLFQAAAVLVPINTRFKGREAAEILSRSQARVLVTVTDFLGVDYISLLRTAGVELPGWIPLSWPMEESRTGPRTGKVLLTGRPTALGPRSTADGLPSVATTCRTSSSHPGPRVLPKEW